MEEPQVVSGYKGTVCFGHSRTVAHMNSEQLRKYTQDLPRFMLGQSVGTEPWP